MAAVDGADRIRTRVGKPHGQEPLDASDPKLRREKRANADAEYNAKKREAKGSKTPQKQEGLKLEFKDPGTKQLHDVAKLKTAAQIWLDQGYPVTARIERSFQTSDFYVEGVGLVEVKSPMPKTDMVSIVKTVKASKAQAKIAQINLDPKTILTEAQAQMLPDKVFQASSSIKRVVVSMGNRLIIDKRR